MKILETPLKDLLIIEPTVYGDTRGYFMESYRADIFNNEPLNTTFIQDNESKSSFGVLRGLHYQLPPFAQAKLVRVICGEILDVAVDIRRDSPTFGKSYTITLSAENKKQLFIPRGFAHGFSVTGKEAVVIYKCDNYYSPEHEAGIAYNDPDLNIDWIISPNDLILSPKDSNHPGFKNAKLF